MMGVVDIQRMLSGLEIYATPQEREINGTDGIYPCRLRGPDDEWIDYPLTLNVEGIGSETSFLGVLTTVEREKGQLGYDCHDKLETLPCFKDL